METHVSLVGQIYWDSLCQRRRTNVHCENSGVTYAADALRDTNTRFSFFTGL